MPRERDQFTAARSALVGYAAAGRFGWGHPLVATSLAAELGLSPTPVREALAHLAGEGIIEHHPGRGYYAPSPTAADIVGIYELHQECLRWSLGDEHGNSQPRSSAVPGPVDPIEAIFDAIVRQGRSDAIVKAFRRASAQLRPIRRIERRLENAGLDTVLEIKRCHDTGKRAELVHGLGEYHSQRLQLAPMIEKVMRQSASSILEI